MLTRFLTVCLMLVCVNSVWGCELSEKDLEGIVKMTCVPMRYGAEKSFGEIEELLEQHTSVKQQFKDRLNTVKGLFMRTYKKRFEDSLDDMSFYKMIDAHTKTLGACALEIERAVQEIDSTMGFCRQR